MGAIALLASCGGAGIETAPAEVAAALEPSDLLRQHVDFLATGPEPRDWTHPAGLERAADYIAAQLDTCGGRVTDQDFVEDGRTYRNVCASFGPESGERIVVGAHYDVCDELPGADDNASGVAVLIEVGRALGSLELAGPVDLVAYALEEPPFFGSESMGSAWHARELSSRGAEVRAMICLEMVGYYSDEPGSQDYPLDAMKLLYPTVGNFIAVVGREADREVVDWVHSAMDGREDLPAVKLLAPASMVGMDFSDHRNYWAAGYPAVMVTDTAFYRNPNYHGEGDTPGTLDYGRMALVAGGVVKAVRSRE